MEHIRKIVREELILISEEGNKDERLIDRHPIFSDPEKSMEYAMEWIEMANTLKLFRQSVGIVLWNMDSPEEKIEELKELYSEYIKI